MKHLSLLRLFAPLVLLFSCELSHAAAFQFYELGAPINGTAGVGQASVANDASTVYFNPAGMIALPASELLIGTQIALPYQNFSPQSATTFTGNNGGSAGVLAPSMGVYYAYHMSPQLGLGISLTSPYGGALSYNNHWVGRYMVQQMTFYTMNLNPSIAYQVNQWLALGAGIAVEYANLNETLALPVTPFIDGQANLKLDSVSPGFNLGVLMVPDETTRIGIAYRSQIVHHLHGNVDFLNLSFVPSASTKMVMPANIIASLSQQFSSQFTLLGELGWANWSSMRDTIVFIDGLSAVTTDNWHNTYRIGLGGQYKFPTSLLLEAGVSYDSSPTGSSRRLPDLPMDRQIRVGVGLHYPIMSAASLAASYEYINLGRANINNISTAGTLSGSYDRNYANIFQISLNVNC